MGELVDEDERRPSVEHGVEVEVGESRPLSGERPSGHHLEPTQLFGGVDPAVVLDQADHDVGAARGRRRPSASMA